MKPACAPGCAWPSSRALRHVGQTAARGLCDRVQWYITCAQSCLACHGLQHDGRRDADAATEARVRGEGVRRLRCGGLQSAYAMSAGSAARSNGGGGWGVAGTWSCRQTYAHCRRGGFLRPPCQRRCMHACMHAQRRMRVHRGMASGHQVCMASSILDMAWRNPPRPAPRTAALLCCVRALLMPAKGSAPLQCPWPPQATAPGRLLPAGRC